MPACRNNRPRHKRPLNLAGIAALAGALLFALPAAAQNGPPIQLIPPAQRTAAPQGGTPLNNPPAPPQSILAPPPPPPAQTPPTSAPPASAPPPSVPPGPRSAGTVPAGITAEPLAPVDAAWVGVLPRTEGGLPRTLWQGTARSTVTAILPQLAPSTSPALQGHSHGGFC